jgi:hypothetical protein
VNVIKWVLLLVAAAVLGYGERTRIRRKESSLPEVVANIAVSSGLIGLLAYPLNVLGNFSERILSISEVLILGGVALGLSSALYNKFRGGAGKNSI